MGASNGKEINRQPPKEFRNALRQRGYKFGHQVDPKKADVLELIGSGGFSTIFRIYQADNTVVALKYTEADRIADLCNVAFQSTNNLAQMQRVLDVVVGEAQKLAELSHPFVIHFLEAFTIDKDMGNGKKAWKMAALVMEFCDGETLQTEIDKAIAAKSEIPIDRLNRWFLQLALALEYVHHLGYIHLDVKPKNVFLQGKNNDKHVVLGDFGITRSIQECINGGGQSSALIMKLGEAQFFSPERVRPNKFQPGNSNAWRATPSDDVWAYGVTLYYAAVLNFPFPSDNMGVLVEIATTEPKPLASFDKPAALSSLVEKLLVKNSGERLNMEQVVRDEFFADSLLDRNTFRKCPGNLTIHVKTELGRGRSTSGADRTLDGLWLDTVLKAFEDFTVEYQKWKEAVLIDFVPACEAEAQIIWQVETGSHIGQITGGATGIVGGGISLAGIVITLTGILAPLGIPLTIAGAAVGGVGALAAGGSAVVGAILGNKEMKKLKSKQDEVRKLDENLAELLKKLMALFPEKDLEDSIGHDGDGGRNFAHNINVITRVARVAFKAGDAAADVVTLVAKTALATTARTISYILLPIGFALDAFTIVSSAVRLNKSDAADYLEALCVVLKSKDTFIQEAISIIEQQITTKNQLLKKCHFGD